MWPHITLSAWQGMSLWTQGYPRADRHVALLGGFFVAALLAVFEEAARRLLERTGQAPAQISAACDSAART